MTNEMEKKEYVAPAMTIVDLDVESNLLCCSDTSSNEYSGTDGDEYID